MAKRGIYRRRHRKDGNQDAIVAFYRACGVSVYMVGEPVDLVVGLGGVTDLVEVKTEAGKLNPDQVAFSDGWLGSLWCVRSLPDVRRHVVSLQRRSKLLGAAREAEKAS